MVLGVVWHFWFAPILVLTVLAILALTAIGYARKVSAPRYPKN
jgi:hypothetical protein